MTGWGHWGELREQGLLSKRGDPNHVHVVVGFITPVFPEVLKILFSGESFLF